MYHVSSAIIDTPEGIMWYTSDDQHTRVLSSIARPATVVQHVERVRQLELQRRRWIGAIVASAVALLVAAFR